MKTILRAILVTASLGAADVQDGIYTNRTLGVRFTTPESRYIFRTKEFQYGWAGTILEFRSTDGAIGGMLIHGTQKMKAAEYADSRESGMKKNNPKYRRLSERRLDRARGDWLVREHYNEYGDNQLRLLSLYVADGQNNFELLLWSSEAHWEERREEMTAILESFTLEGAVALKCGRCGAPSRPEQKFCSECGAKIEAPKKSDACARCDTKFQNREKFCAECGAPREEKKPDAKADADRLWAEGLKALDENRYEDAESAFTKVIELNPRLDGAWSNRAIARRELGKFQESIADSTQSIKLSPKTGLYRWVRGTTYQRMKDYEKALADLRRAIELDPKLKEKVQPQIEELEKAMEE